MGRWKGHSNTCRALATLRGYRRRVRSDEGFGIGIVALQVDLDGGFEVGDASEDAAANGASMIRPKKRANRLSQETEVGVTCKWNRGCLAGDAFTLACL